MKHVVLCRTPQEVEPHRAAWQALVRQVHTGHGMGEWFAGPLWLEPLLHTFFGDRQWHLLFGYEGDVLTGVLPLVEGRTAGSSCATTAALPVNTHVRRIGMLSAGSPHLVLADLLRAATDAVAPEGYRRCIGLRQVERDGAFDHAIRVASAATHLAVNTFDESRSAVVDIPNGWSAYVATRSSEQLHPLRKRRKLDKAGGWVFREADVSRDFADTWERVLHVERRSWKQGAGTSIDNEPGAHPFYRGVAEGCTQEGSLRIHLLEHDGVAVAHTVGVVQGTTYYLLKHSYDESHRQLSPGFQLMWHVMEQSVAQGCTRLDLLGDAMSWKLAVATSTPVYRSHMLFTSSTLHCQRCRFTNQILKPVGRRLGVKRLLAGLREHPHRP